MSVDSVLKRANYWIRDFFHGAPMLKMYMDSKRVDSNIEYGRKWQNDRINDILSWATENTELYKDYKGKKLEDFPVVNKLILTQNHSANEVDHDKLTWQKGDVFIQRTSGSTGVPFEVPMDTRKRQRRVADLKFYNHTVGFYSHEKTWSMQNLDSVA